MSNIRQFALRLLMRREHSRFELKNKLAKKGFSSEEIENIIRELQEENLLSDARFAEVYIRSRSQTGIGPRRIILELKTKGIDGDLAAELVKEVDKKNWRIILEKVWQKKLKTLKATSNKKYLQGFNFLLQRGFDAALIKQVIGGMNDYESADE